MANSTSFEFFVTALNSTSAPGLDGITPAGWMWGVVVAVGLVSFGAGFLLGYYRKIICHRRAAAKPRSDSLELKH